MSILPTSRGPGKSIGRSLHMKVSLAIILPMVLVLVIFVVYQYTHHRSESLKSLSTMASYNGLMIEQSLRPAWQVSDFNSVQNTLDGLRKNPRLHIVYILDLGGKVIFSPGQMDVGTRLDNQSPLCIACHQLQPADRPSGIIVTEPAGSQVFRSMQPILNGPPCQPCHGTDQRVLGVLLTDISIAPFLNAYKADLKDNLLLGLSTILVSAIIVNVALNRLVIKRLGRVASALADFGSGKRDLYLASHSNDEIGKLEADFNSMEHQIQEKETANALLSEELHRQTTQQQELLKQLISAQEAERGRVARELHDELGQALSGISLHLQVTRGLITTDPERAREQLEFSRLLIEKTTEQMHNLIVALRPSVLDDVGLIAALYAHGERIFKNSGISFTLDSASLGDRLPREIETVLYRSFQEALTNIVKHSGATKVTIRLARLDGVVEGEVADNGKGFDLNEAAHVYPAVHRLGLLGMKERLTQCNGTMDIYSIPGKGTSILIHIPLSERQHE